jgi:large conductance mechanosensitive channel
MVGPMKVGLFLGAVLNFFIIAFIIFWIVKLANRFKKPAPAPVVVVDPGPTKDQALLMEIRDALRNRA